MSQIFLYHSDVFLRRQPGKRIVGYGAVVNLSIKCAIRYLTVACSAPFRLQWLINRMKRKGFALLVQICCMRNRGSMKWAFSRSSMVQALVQSFHMSHTVTCLNLILKSCTSSTCAHTVEYSLFRDRRYLRVRRVCDYILLDTLNGLCDTTWMVIAGSERQDQC